MEANIDLDRFPSEAFESLYATGHWLYTQLRIEKAMPVFRAMIQLVPTDERGWIGLGACHEVLDHLTVAQIIYEAGLLQTMNHPNLRAALNRLQEGSNR